MEDCSSASWPAGGDQPDEQHEAGRSSQRDDEGAEHRESQEVGEHSVTVVPVETVSQSCSQVCCVRARGRHTPALVENLVGDRGDISTPALSLFKQLITTLWDVSKSMFK